jgi:chromosome segregation ATPase
MNVIRKILAVIVMILAALGLVICIVGLIGAWVVNEPATQAVSGALDTVENYVSVADQTAQLVSGSLSDVQQDVNRVNEAVANITPEDRARVAAEIRQTVSEQIGPKVTRVRTTAAAVGDTIVKFNQTLESANRIPGVTVPTLSNELQAAGERIEEVESALEAVRSSIAETNLDGSKITAATAQVSNGLQKAQDALAQGQSRIQATSAAVATAKANVAGWFDLASLLASLFFILFGAGQVFLFIAALQWFRKPA